MPSFEDAKDCLTVLLGGNAAGDFRFMPLLVYQSENSNVLKNTSDMDIK
jgi:hypothetical protein